MSEIIEETSIDEEGYEEISDGDLFHFEKEGDTIKGELVEIRQGKYGNVYDLETEEGLKTVFGKTILDKRMRKVEIGNKVKIEYAGEIKTGSGRLAQNFKVSLKR